MENLPKPTFRLLFSYLILKPRKKALENVFSSIKYWGIQCFVLAHLLTYRLPNNCHAEGRVAQIPLYFTYNGAYQINYIYETQIETSPLIIRQKVNPIMLILKYRLGKAQPNNCFNIQIHSSIFQKKTK